MRLDINSFERFGEPLVTVDSHTAGEPTRLVVGGLPALPGETINDKRLFVRENLDHVRLLLTQEPRGHRDMFGAIATPPVSPEGDFGLIFMDAKRYPYMCGHGTIGAVATFIEMGWLPVDAGEREKLVVVDTPSGIVRAHARLDHRPDGRVRVESVAIQIEAAFVHQTGQPVEVPGVGVLSVDVVCVGGYFAMVSADQIDIPLTASRAKDLADLGMAIIEASNRQLTIQHPTREFVNTIDVTEFYTPGTSSQTCSAVIYGESHVDRSPCGTGTSAKMALLHHHGLMAVGDTFANRGLLGTTFEGRIVEETTVGDSPAIVPEIRGSAHITGLHRFVVAEGDPFPQGFLF
jgi:proline racemase